MKYIKKVTVLTGKYLKDPFHNKIISILLFLPEAEYEIIIEQRGQLRKSRHVPEARLTIEV